MQSPWFVVAGLVQLHVSNVGMTDEGMDALYQCILFNSTFEVLGLCKNGFTNRAANRILEGLRVNSHIKEIELWGMCTRVMWGHWCVSVYVYVYVCMCVCVCVHSFAQHFTRDMHIIYM